LTNLGFLTVLRETNGYLGGYLVTNVWGRPLEFRLSSAVQPNRVQQILFSATLEPYICADLIGKTLVDKTPSPVQMIVTDRERVLDLRNRVDYPVVWLCPSDGQAAAEHTESGVPTPSRKSSQRPFACHPRFMEDMDSVRRLLSQLDHAFDLAEPFSRIHEAIGEARKMGVHK
jgi:hypothetical protein